LFVHTVFSSLVHVPRPPCCTLFPYTTLFRSCKKGRIDVVVCDGFVGNVVLKFYESAGRMFMGMMKQAFPDVLGRPEAKQHVGERDRKSTRLNSSHQIISYAVFCLKKKKNTQT